jgi:hypothetical protein
VRDLLEDTSLCAATAMFVLQFNYRKWKSGKVLGTVTKAFGHTLFHKQTSAIEINREKNEKKII